MSDERISIREWVKNFDEGKYDSNDRSTQIDAGWYDWFCSDKSLGAKTKKLGKNLKKIINSKKINQDTMYVFFKNNCPCNGSLYDDFRICDMVTGDVIWTITPKSGHKTKNGNGEVWGKENHFEEAIFIGTWKEIKNWFNEIPN